MKKSILTVALLLFVGVSLLVAISDVVGWRQAASTENDGTTPEQAALPLTVDQSARFTAIYFHASHRCPTCKKIEAYAHDALKSEIEQGRLTWEVADYTSEKNKLIVDKCKVFTSTVVLVDRQDGQLVRWKNLEDVWKHTDDAEGFAAFINDSWDKFKKASS